MAILKYGMAATAGVGAATVGWSILATRRLNRFARLFLILAAAAFAVGVYAFLIEPNWIEVSHVVIHDRNLADVVGDTKMVQITDIHLTEGIGFRERALIRKVNGLKPDIIFFTGDIVDDLTQVEPARELIRSLKAGIGIFGIAGDTDHIVMDGKSLARELDPAGADFLVDEYRRIPLENGNFLWLMGLDSNSGADELDRMLAAIPGHVPKILLAESPDMFEETVERRIPLLLVGDTHGGQIGIPLLIHMSEYANRTPYMKGLFERGSTKMYVNRGIGTKTLPIRFLCRPEIAVIKVKP